MKAALRIAILYVLLSGLYILVSDAMVIEVARGDPGLLAQWQGVKGLAFVTMSGIIIFFLVFHYVRSRDRAELRVQELRESFEKLFERTPVPTYAFDPATGEFLAANEAAVREYGYSREEFRHLGIEQIYPPEDRERIRAHLVRIAHLPSSGRWRHQRRDGSIFPVETITHSIVLAGREVRMAVTVNMTVRELTEQALTEAVTARREAEETRSNLLSTISHEMRTPLNAIMGGLDVIVCEEDPVRRQEFARLAQNGAQKLLLLIQRFIDAAALRSPHGHRQLDTIELKPFLRGIATGVSPAAEAKGLTLDLNFDPALPDLAELDVARLGETLRILLGNAIKFSDGGRIEFSARLLRKCGRDALEIAVSDEGIGIPPEKHSQVFESFFQADQNRSRRHGGTGLGLFVARQLCELAGADLNLTSEPDHGSTFTIKLVGTLDDRCFVAGEDPAAASDVTKNA